MTDRPDDLMFRWSGRVHPDLGRSAGRDDVASSRVIRAMNGLVGKTHCADRIEKRPSPSGQPH